MKLKIILNRISINGQIFKNGDVFETSDQNLLESLKINKFAEEIREEKAKKFDKVDKINELE
jgi:hypothetical protein